MNRQRGNNSIVRRLARLSCAALSFVVAAVSLPAQPRSKYDVEAADLYNFSQFVRWPADTLADSKNFDICVLGKDPFPSTLDRLIANGAPDGRTIHRRDIAAAPEAAGCAIVYVSDSEAGKIEKICAALDGKGQLLVSDLPHFLQNGGAIQFVIEKHHVRFAVNLDAASKNRLIMSADLLKVAFSVTGKPQKGAAQ